MRWDDIYVAGTGVWLPGEVSVEAAIREGRYNTWEAQRSGQLALTVADPEEWVPDMAARAARLALRRSGHGPDDVALLLYAGLMHAGVDLWNAASYIQRRSVGAQSLVAETRSGSNGGLIGLELACAYLRADPVLPAAVVTSADAWPDTVFDRWRADSGLVFGDGGSAIVVSRQRGFARLVSMVTTTDPELEGLHRGDEDFSAFRQSPSSPIDLYRRAQEFLRIMSKDEVWKRGTDGLRAAADRALHETGIGMADVTHIVMPFFGCALLTRQCLEPLQLDISRTTWEFGRRVGHLGAGDQFAGLDHLVSSGRLASGDHVLLVGVGSGFTWTCAVLDVLEPTPPWSTDPPDAAPTPSNQTARRYPSRMEF